MPFQERLIDPRFAAARVRAALAYANLSHEETALRTGLSVPTLRRIVSASSPRGAGIEELWAIADACGVPRGFIEDGFEPFRQTGDQASAAGVDDLRAVVLQLSDDLRALRADVEVLDAEASRRSDAAALASQGQGGRGPLR